jgi:hypothetical protein
MHHTSWIRSLGLALVAVALLSMGTRPSIRASQPSATIATASVGGGFAAMGDDPLSNSLVAHLAAKPMSAEATKVWLKLQEKVAMQFPNDTPLEDVLKYIQASTTDKVNFPEGIPIYVNPVGLQEAEKTQTSTVSLDLKGIPLATTLKLILDQLGLAYRVHPDGFLLITNRDAQDLPPDADAMILDNLSALRQEVRQLRMELILLREGRADHQATPSPVTPPPGGMGSKGGMM